MRSVIRTIIGVICLGTLCSCGGDKEVKVPEGAATAVPFNVDGIGKVTPIVSYYDFRKDDLPLQISGISGAEPHGRWTDGDVSNIVVPSLPFSQYTLKVRVHVTANDLHKTAMFDVFVNDSPAMMNVSLPEGEHIFYIDVKKEWLTIEGTANIRFDHKNAYVVCEANRDANDTDSARDTRKINIGFIDMVLYGYAVE